MVKDIIGSVYEVLVPEKVRKIHRASAEIEGKKLGKVLGQAAKTAMSMGREARVIER